MKDLEAKKRVLEKIMEWADGELLEDLKARKTKPKALEVAVIAQGKPKDEDEGEHDEMGLEDDCELREGDEESDDDKEARLKRLFK